MSALQWLSTAALPLFIVLTLAFSFAKKRDPYEAFLEGAKGGAKIVFQTMPYVVAMVFAVKIFQASGLFDWVGRLLGPLLEPLGIPPEVVPIAALRPFSGGGSLGAVAFPGSSAEGFAPHICLSNHLHQENLGRVREKSKKRVYKSGIF